MDKAVELLRSKGIREGREARRPRSERRRDRAATSTTTARSAVLVELNCETDFVARTEDFGRRSSGSPIRCSRRARSTASSTSAEGRRSWQRSSATPATLADALKQLTGKIGENIVLRRYARFGGSGAVGAYVHHNGKVGTLVEVAGVSGEAGQQLARTVAEHIAAGVPTIPVAVTRDDVPAEHVDRERRIFAEQAAASGKPANIVEKIVEGRSTSSTRRSRCSTSRGSATTARRFGDLVKERRPRPARTSRSVASLASSSGEE